MKYSATASPRPGRGRGTTALPLLLTGTLLLSTACTVANSEGAGAGSADGSTLRVVLPQEPPTLEPCESSLTATGVVVRSNITEPLIRRDAATGDLLPQLATDWEQTSPETWSLDLRSKVAFHDGSPFTAEDAAYSIDRALTFGLSCNVQSYIFGSAELTVEAESDTRLTITTDEPDPILPLRLTYVEMVPRDTDPEAKVRTPVGTGPFVVGSWQTGSMLTLNRNDDYWGEAPAFERTRYVWRSDPSVRAAMIDRGEADIALGLDPMEAEKDTTRDYPNNQTTGLRLDGREAPLDDHRVRRAIGMAIDREGIAAAVMGGLGTPAAQLVPPGVLGHNEELRPPEFDPAAARALVAEAAADGVPTDRTITILARNGQFPGTAETAEVLQYALEQIGLDAAVRMVETATHVEYQVRPHPADAGPIALIFMHGNQAGDAGFTTSQYLLSEGPQSTFGDAELDGRIADANRLAGDEREQAFAELLAYQDEELTQYAPLAHMRGLIGVAPTVDYEPTPSSQDNLRLAEVTPRKAADH